MVEVVPMVFPHDLVWDDILGKFKYLGKFDDKIGHPCPIDMRSAGWCLSICEYAKSTIHDGVHKLVCAYAITHNQSVRESLKKDKFNWSIEDYTEEVKDGIEHYHRDEILDEGLSRFKPTPENPWGFTIEGKEPWEYGLVEKPILDPKIKRPTFKEDKK